MTGSLSCLKIARQCLVVALKSQQDLVWVRDLVCTCDFPPSVYSFSTFGSQFSDTVSAAARRESFIATTKYHRGPSILFYLKGAALHKAGARPFIEEIALLSFTAEGA